MIHPRCLIVWACLPILICVNVNAVSENAINGKLIVVNPLVGYEDRTGMSMDCNIGNCSGENEHDSCVCMNERNCLCTKFEDALHHVEDNTVIVLNGTLREFRANVILNDITNISIIGYHRFNTVNCHARGSVVFNNCKNVVIENITWISCGNNGDDRSYSSLPGIDGLPVYIYHYDFRNDFFRLYSSGLTFNTCTDITLQSCTFEASMVGIYEASGVVYINHVHFFSTNAYDLPGGFSLATGLIINQRNVPMNNSVVIRVFNSLFSQSDRLNMPTNLLLFYMLLDDPESAVQVFVSKTNFSSASYDPGWAAENGMVWIRISSSRNVYIEFNGVNFLSNKFQPEFFSLPLGVPESYNSAALFYVASKIYSRNNSIKIKIDSCTFLNNYATGIAVFQGDMYLDVINTQFHSNNADIVLFVEYFENRFITTTLKLIQSTFANNTGGQLILLTGGYLLIKISGLQIINNTLLPDYDGLVLFTDYYTLIADISNVRYELNHIVGEGSGFRFISATTIWPFGSRFVHRATLYSSVCIPSIIQVVLPQQYVFEDETDTCFDKSFQWLSIINSSFSHNIGGGHGAVIYFNHAIIDGLTNSTINTCTFNSNSEYRSLIHASSRASVDVDLIVKDSTFMHNTETVFYVVNQTVQFSNDVKKTLFDSNRAQNGAALYINYHNLNSKLIFTNNSMVSFRSNIARRYGGAIFYNISQLSNTCYNNSHNLMVNNNALVEFKNNQARAAGNAVFFSISQSCNGTLQYDEPSVVYGQSAGEVVMSPNRLKLYHPAQLTNRTDLDNIDTYYINGIMLGQDIIIPACTVDLNGMPLWSTQFTLQLVRANEQNYSIQGSEIISIDCKTFLGINNLFITGPPSLSDITSTLVIQLNSFYDSTFDWKPITVNLNVRLSSCHLGFYYSSDVEHCICYTTDNIVTCSGSNSIIRNGYWFGTVDDQPTVTICPINYCNFDNCEATTGTCDLHPLRDNQCRAHRSGAACGNCEEGYSLSFDSIECINIDSCTIGHTVLVITMSFLYWITFTGTVFGMMYFKIGLGYLYGITFYYSIIDIFLGNILAYANNLYQLVATLSSIAKLLPQFLGQLCFVKGMSGIDQQFIHYLHPLAVLLILAIISVSARYSYKLSMFLSRAVIHAICLLLLLSYSSIASTSLLLLRAIRFTNVDKVYSYLSPDIEYFHGRHLFFGLIAIVTGLVITIGLPLLLLLQPFVNSKVNFVKIKPLLDQFQGCYKDKFRYFASYYMIFRLMILGILAVNETNALITLYLLQVICIMMILVHVTVRPYINNIVNVFDSLMLATLVLVISLQIIETSQGFLSNTALGIAFVLVILPLFVFLLIVMYSNIQNIKKLFLYCKSTIKLCLTTKTTNNEVTEMPVRAHNTNNEIGITIDENVRRNAIIVGM